MQRLEPLRKCIKCGLIAYTEADLDKFVRDNNYFHNHANICQTCYRKLYNKGGPYWPAQKRWHTARNKASIKFKGQMIYLDNNPRRNVCSICGKKYPEDLKKQTLMHHDFYDNSNPLNGTRELCQSCHSIFHHTGTHHLEEHKRKIGEALRGRHLSEESKLKISKTLKGHSISKETRKKISDSLKGRSVRDIRIKYRECH